MTKTKLIHFIIITLVALFFVLPLCFMKSIANAEVLNRNWSVPIFYGVMAIISTTTLIGYCVFFKNKYFWLLLTIISVCICNVGYFALSLSSTINEAILANKIAYFGNVFLPLFLLITITDVCRFRYSKFIVRLLFAISCIFFIFIATSGYFDLFYKNIEFKMIDGVVFLHKTYGILHTFYLVYILTYFALMIGVIFYSHKKDKLISQKHVVSLLFVVFINILLWLIERFVHISVEALSLSYNLTTLLTIYLYKQLNSFGLLDYCNVSLDVASEEEKKNEDSEVNEELSEDLIIEDNFANYSDDKLKEMFKNLNIDSPLTDREIEVAVLMIKNIKRKKIAEFLFVTEHTIKFHVSSIFKKTNVANRNELADLLKENK